MKTHRKVALAADLVVIILLGAMVGCTQMNMSLSPSQPQGQRLPTTLPAMADPRILVIKHARKLSLYDRQRLVKQYACCTGLSDGDKQREGDKRTPEGQFFVCYKNPRSKFTLSMGLNYPNVEDADRGLRSGLITAQQRDAIVAANQTTTAPAETWEALWKTPLGGEIMIHGAGADRQGTLGCVGMNDDDIRELFDVIPIGTPVVIEP